MELTIRRPTEPELPALRALWQVVFGDPAEYIAAFEQAADPCKTALCAFREDGWLAGMLFLLPAVLTLQGAGYEARYVYAVATERSCRGQGVFTALQREAERVALADGAYALTLLPSSPSLYEMYQKFGYRTRFGLSETRVSPMASPVAALSPCDRSDFLTLRRNLLRGMENSFDLYPSLCEFRYTDILAAGGEIWLARTPYGRGYLVGRREDELYRVAETSLTGLALSHAAGALCRATGARRVSVCGKSGVRRPAGMIKILDERIDPRELAGADPYMHLMLNGI